MEGSNIPDEVDLLFDYAKSVFQQAPHWGFGNIDYFKDGHPRALDKEFRIPPKFVRIVHEVSNKLPTTTTASKWRWSGPSDDAEPYTEMLRDHTWDAKPVIVVAALALIFARYGVIFELYEKHPSATSLAALKPLIVSIVDLPEFHRVDSTLRKNASSFLNRFISKMLRATELILRFKKLYEKNIKYINPKHPPLSSVIQDSIPTTTNDVIAAACGCAMLFMSLRNQDISDVKDVLGVNMGWTNLEPELSNCHEHIEKMKYEENYRNLIDLFEKSKPDNISVLRHLIYLKEDDKFPLVQDSTKKAQIEVLKGKEVLLLISELDISHKELMILGNVYESRSMVECQYEIVWLPMVGKSYLSNEEQKVRYENLQSIMPWYTLQYPELQEPAGIRYIKEKWHFENKTIVVVLDPQGKVICKNAFHIIFIWGNMAFPFSTMQDEALWKDKTLNLELLVDSIDLTINEWIQKGKHICLYGGDDLEWIKKFTSTAKEVATIAGVALELVYIGKSNANEQSKEIIETIENEKLSQFWHEPTWCWHFWTRLEYMLYSRMQLASKKNNNVENNDHILQGLKTILSFNVSLGEDEPQGWAIFSCGLSEIVTAKVEMIMQSFERFEVHWKQNARVKGFVPALKEDLQQVPTPEHCNRLILPHIEDEISEMPVFCPDCNGLMEVYTIVRCYIDD